ncbi:single-strand DNA endonuclease ASTE1-like [Babylonia areolata]|uniref:single-strand DNA endonuclease ASTE1-like n=1 Tax=Babylonia areolata TaxID=304850 RepID=UPI003FD2F1EB
MGIHGLTSFIDNNPHLLKDHQLHNCRVVIDGNNFYHFLYFYCNVRFQFGGDYDIYQRKISMIFSLFKSCNVEVFVVFDGAYTVDGKKFKTTLGRGRDRVYAAQRIMNGQRGVLIPCLAQHTFRQALDTLGIPHVTCDFEADNQLVTLANRWNCPVISNDSDFYIFDLSGGFIPLDYIDFRLHQLPPETSPDGSTCSCLPVQYYHVDEFIKCFKSLNRTVLPLFATMLGNDYVNAAAFEAFYQKKTPKIASRRYSASKKHQKIVSVLYWLEDKQHEGELISEVLSFIRPERRQQVQRLLTSSISGYLETQEFESFDLKAFLEGDQLAAMQDTEAVVGVTGEHLPAWFVAACRHGKIPVFLLNAVLLRHVILPAQVESKTFPAASTASREIRGVMYGLLLGDHSSPPPSPAPDLPQHTAPEPSPVNTNCETGDSHPQTADRSTTSHAHISGNVSGDKRGEPGKAESPGKSESDSDTSPKKQAGNGVVEYTRHNLELRRILVSPCVSVSTCGALPSLETLPDVGEGERLAILMDTLGMTTAFVGKFDPSLQLYMMCLVFWAKHAEPPVPDHLLKGIVLSAVLLHVHREIADRESAIIEACIVKGNEDSMETDAVHSGEGIDTPSSGATPTSGVPQQHPQQLLCVHNKTTQKTKEGQTFSIAATCQSESNKVLSKVRDNLKKYYHDPTKISSKNPPVQEVFHDNAQFLACLLDIIHLNSLLSSPCIPPHPAFLFNGSFVYTIVHELQVRSNPDLFLSEMLVKGSSLMVLFDALCSAVMQEAGEVFAEKSSQGKKCCKSAKKRKKQQTAAGGKQTARDGAWSGENRTGQGEGAFCDLNNRFGVLMMDDDS